MGSRSSMISANDLVLDVSENVDPKVFDISKYEDFIDAICGDRNYQKEAIKKVLLYFLGKNYNNLRELAKRNWERNPTLQQIFPSFQDFEEKLEKMHLPDKLSCSIELATATGKSYVIYAIARIMLAEGIVNRVLVLCPSTTIEKGLTEKFKQLSQDQELLRLLPQDAKIKVPRIISGNQTISEGDICVENVHAIYERTLSSVRESLKGKGETTLVINDEVHHAYNKSTDRKLKKWKEFLLDPQFNFKYILGDTGTAYITNEYFLDVIYRYSLRQAMEDKFVKLIRYAVEGGAVSEEEQFQMIYKNHLENKRKYKKIKPLTIIITRDIKTCKELTERWIKFLARMENISIEEAEKKVLIVTSSPEHQQNALMLDRVDDKDNPVEWITSVSMLTEGWDVKNVFQIVPHEKRAFNSKLLIAQVLGRGLRIPSEYKGEQPVVTVFNHVRWAQEIRRLVEDVMEFETRISIYPLPEKDQYNFEIHQIEYELKEKPRETKFEMKEIKKISFSPQVEKIEKRTEYEKAITYEREVVKTEVEYEFFTVDEVAQDIWNRLAIYDRDAGTNYSKQYTLDKIKKLLKTALRKIGEKRDIISAENRLKAIQAFGILKRKVTKSPKYEISVKSVIKIPTKDMQKWSVGLSQLRRGHVLFYDINSSEYGEESDRKLLEKIEEDETIPKSSTKFVKNAFLFKTPLNTVVASSKPEAEFIKRLIEKENAINIDAWIKSRDVGFYSIEYYWRKGEHHKKGSFNPDFFIKKGKTIIVVEIKEDALINRLKEEKTDTLREHKAKYRYAKRHFDMLNKLQNERKYYFFYLTPKDFDKFFKYLREDKIDEFESEIAAILK